MNKHSIQTTVEEAAMHDYIDKYDLFVEVCRERQTDLSSMGLAILHHGYITGE